MSGPGTPASAPVLPEPKWRSEMPKRTCSLDDCTSPVYGRGWCKTHWQRWYRTGDPTGIRPGRWDGYERPMCSVDGCAQPAHAKGMCSSHFCRNRRHDDPLAGRRPNATGDEVQRFLSFVDDVDGCSLWNGGTYATGYGEFTIGGQSIYAHRHAYELFVGPIPDGHHLHHECEVKACVNPDHLTPLTPAEHRKRHACPS